MPLPAPPAGDTHIHRPAADHAAGRAWEFGDEVDTDVPTPGIYMKGSIAELARHCLESLDAGFARA